MSVKTTPQRDTEEHGGDKSCDKAAKQGQPLLAALKGSERETPAVEITIMKGRPRLVGYCKAV